MAIINTGLGWYADDAWLKQESGLIGSIEQGGGGGPIKLTTEWRYYYRATSMSPQYQYWWYRLVSGGPYYLAVTDPVNRKTVSGLTEVVGTVIERYGKSNSTEPPYDGDGGSYYSVTVPSIAKIPGTNYINWGGGTYTGPVESTILPTYNSPFDAASAIGIENEYYKLNSGYAACGFVKYKTNASTTVLAPFAISSVWTSTTLSADGSGSMPMSQSSQAKDNMIFWLSIGASGLDDGTVNGPYVNFAPLVLDDAALFRLLTKTVKLGVGTYTSTDPYSEGGTSEPGGGETGSYTLVQDPIDFPSIPSFSYANAGFFSIWIPSDESLQELAQYMWETDIDTEGFWKKLIADPIDLVIGLSVVPFYVQPDSTPKSVSIGWVDTGVKMDYTDDQYCDVDCGSVTIDPYWDAYLDYNPYTSIEIYLPYIGVRRLNADEVTGKTLHVKYRIDIVSGSCVAMIKVDDAVLYHFTGSCSIPVPITSYQMQGLVSKAITVGTSVAGAVATGGVLPMAGAVASAASLAATKQQAARAGNLGNAAGLLDTQKPYLIVTRPNQALPEHQNEYTGYPSFITENFGDLVGYTEIETTHLHGIPCTNAELAEIETLLKSGVIF